MNRITGFLSVGAVVGLTLTGPASGAVLHTADLIEVAGIDTFITRDTLSGLDWLDVNLTVNTSFIDITNGTATFASLGGLNPVTDLGFRHATKAELSTLFSSASIPNVNAGLTALNFAPVNALMALLGPTFTLAGPTDKTQGFLADLSTTNRAFGLLRECISNGPCPGATVPPDPFQIAEARNDFVKSQ